MKSLTVQITPKEKKYEIFFPETESDFIAELKKKVADRDYVIVTDSNVVQFCTALKSFDSNRICAIPAGEQSKTWKTVNQILDFCFSHHLDRGDVIIGIGGGVVGDITGLAANLYLRGTPVIHVPTSLLAMVDSSIGGKTGIDTRYGKNLIGTIYQPEAIFCSKSFLDTLPEKEMKNGLCEMIKHGIIVSEKHFCDLEKKASEHPKASDIFPLVQDSMKIKAEIVERDEHEAGERMKLNLGHTFGHAIELLSEFQTPHGLAVAIGTMMAGQHALEKNITDDETIDRIENIFHAYGIDTVCPYPEDEVWEAMKHDKKRRDGKLTLVLPKKIGEVVFEQVKI